jgi:hypothetical protein
MSVRKINRDVGRELLICYLFFISCSLLLDERRDEKWHKILFGKPEGKSHLERDVNGRPLLKWT